MKILLLNTSEITGGAAIACNRLLHAIIKKGINAKMLVKDKKTDNINVVTINNCKLKNIINNFRFLWERIIIFLTNHLSKVNLFNVSIANTGNDISNHPLVKEADVIHLHWINQGFLSIKDISKLLELKKPLVWTMHDQWAYTGICHYTSGCNKFENQCFECHKLKNPNKKDISYKLFKQKEKLYKNKNITLVGCSNWIANQAKKSNLSKHASIVSIPNPIDTMVYYPKNKEKMRKLFNFPENKKYILFGACKVTDERKGFTYLKEAGEILLKKKNILKDELMIVVFGGNSNEVASMLPFQVFSVGYINNIEKMVSLYSAVDMFLIPSLEDNLPNTIMESMACGTPCIGFNVGGIPEMIDHKKNGYVAEYKNATDLATGINWIIKEANYNQLSINARNKVEIEYNEGNIAEKYIELYKKILKI